nr:hypothetical protein [uncultured Halomonas sp.]
MNVPARHDQQTAIRQLASAWQADIAPAIQRDATPVMCLMRTELVAISALVRKITMTPSDPLAEPIRTRGGVAGLYLEGIDLTPLGQLDVLKNMLVIVPAFSPIGRNSQCPKRRSVLFQQLITTATASHMIKRHLTYALCLPASINIMAALKANVRRAWEVEEVKNVLAERVWQTAGPDALIHYGRLAEQRVADIEEQTRTNEAAFRSRQRRHLASLPELLARKIHELNANIEPIDGAGAIWETALEKLAQGYGEATVGDAIVAIPPDISGDEYLSLRRRYPATDD